jgi:sugar O-acyltransferase (sialic acid O-acetyltransferase NeuD family)
MKDLLIIGARGWGREVYDIACACINSGQELHVKGFLDDKSDALDTYKNYPPIISSVENYEIQPDDVFICALGDVYQKQKYVGLILDKGGSFISLIHPTAILGNNARIGAGCILGAYSNISSDTVLDDFVTLSIRAGIGHDSTVGRFSHIGGNSNISGFVSVGELVTIHPCCDIVPHRHIGDNATIGTGSVVLSHVKKNTTVFGCPAKVIEL